MGLGNKYIVLIFYFINLKLSLLIKQWFAAIVLDVFRILLKPLQMSIIMIIIYIFKTRVDEKISHLKNNIFLIKRLSLNTPSPLSQFENQYLSQSV